MKGAILPWVLAARPKTLPAAIVPVWVGSYMAKVAGQFSWLLFGSTLVSCICIQIATNLFNDAIDAKKGADTEARRGPKRVTASGLLSSKAVMWAATVVCALAAVAALPMILERGWPVIAIGAVSLFFAYGYTGGPFPLAYRGMGEIFVLIFFGFVAVGGSWFVQTGQLPGEDQWLIGLAFGLLSCVLIAINNLRDTDEDKTTGKKTLAVRFGKRFAKNEIAIFCIVPFVIVAPLCQGWEKLWWIPMFTLLIVITTGTSRAIFEPLLNRLLAISALQLILYAVVFTVVYRG